MKPSPFCVLTLFLSGSAFGQAETFDMATYTPPKGWKKDAKPEVVNYTTVDAAAGTFCVVAIYASTASTGDSDKDFKRDWKELVVKPYAADADPKTETQTTPDGWKAVVGAAPVKVDGLDCYIILTVVSGFGKSLCIRTSLNDQAYTPQVDAFLETIELDKTKAPPASAGGAGRKPPTGTVGKFGAMRYVAPAGWSEEVFPDGVVFKPLDLPKAEHLYMQVMPPLAFTGSLEEALSRSYDEAAAMYKSTKMYYAGGAEYQKTEARTSFQGWEYMQGKGGVQVENGTPYKTELGLDLFVVKINNRFERVAVLKSRNNCGLSRYYSADRLQYRHAIDNFLFALQFVDGKRPTLKPGTTKGDGIVGVWQGISLSTTARGSMRYKVYSPIFLSNGQAYFGTNFPSEGLDGLDTRIPPELNRRDWGTYEFGDGRGVLKMPYADIPLRTEADKLVITANRTDHRFYRLKSVDGARFSGTYGLSEVDGRVPSIAFTADGGFTDDGAVKVLYHEYVDCINPCLAPGSGTYEVKNYSILFKYADGRSVKLAFLGAEYDLKDRSPASLRMSSNEDEMHRQ